MKRYEIDIARYIGPILISIQILVLREVYWLLVLELKKVYEISYFMINSVPRVSKNR